MTLSRGILHEEPFQGKTIGPFIVCGPSVAFYEELVGQFADAQKLQSNAIKELAEALKAKESEVLLDNPPSDPENDSSVILCAVYDNKKFLFTADAGPLAFEQAKNVYNLSVCRWMQIPHHGSRRNVTPSLIEYFCPDVAFASAAGNEKHPRQAVVDAFKNTGAKVYSTHYPEGAHLWHSRGDVPARSDYSSATPL